MDLLGEIVEKEVEAPVAPSFRAGQPTGGFPKPRPKSAWKARQEKKRQEDQQDVKKSKDGYEIDETTGMKRLPKEKQNMDYSGMSEAERIHMENIEILSKMSDEQRAREKEELLGTMDPNILQALLRRTEKKEEELKGKNAKKDMEFEGYGTWIGGGRNGEEWMEPRLDKDRVDEALGIKSLPADGLSDALEKKVRFDSVTQVKYEEDPIDDGWEDVEDLDEIAPASYQLAQEASNVPLEEAMNTVHFPKPAPVEEDDYKIDINDPDFQEKLHEKYFPDLPKDTEKLKWMEPMPEIDTSSLVFDNVSDLRFDFKGNLMVPGANKTIDISKGLHHHSDTPSLAGYTMMELARLARSTVPGQRCIAIQTLGRILHKLGKGKYNIVPEFVSEENDEPVEADADTVKKAATEFDQMFWGMIDELRIIETLEEAADENLTRNLSVRSYATEALWLWKQGGGNKRHAT
ncbi:CYFA0S05e03356g1_1 [Cyberlindnera fabianii]|uniref:CYFA0S05e03356g1_1 n=1 Tax=Cyberlindnera fabianii TaxID=36022 RepID=A0A061AST4_CYBFA|nr:RNA polymerase II-associated protein RBA50 [Cyberlindnera fabianii]CDR40693.1 CYFA0S05e03356g1_1 [Cyberlindnera fabianii]